MKRKWISVVLLLFFLASSMVAGTFLLEQSVEQNPAMLLEPPGKEFWFGTDSLGRDMFSRVMVAARTSVLISAAAAVLAGIIAVVYGAVAAISVGWLDRLMMRVADIFYSLPPLLLAMLFLALLGRSMATMIMALALFGWVKNARLVRALIREELTKPYVEAARSLGVSKWGLLARHILPNVQSTIYVSIAISLAGFVLAEAFLGFLGIGIAPPHASWGTLIHDGWQAFQVHPALIVFPSLFLLTYVVLINLIVAELQDQGRGRFK